MVAHHTAPFAGHTPGGTVWKPGGRNTASGDLSGAAALLSLLLRECTPPTSQHRVHGRRPGLCSSTYSRPCLHCDPSPGTCPMQLWRWYEEGVKIQN